ncbi:MAG: UDP-N-acetylmuramate dehydrogenase [Cryomorphaceae bacterium]
MNNNSSNLNVQRGVSLQPHNTMAVSASADYLLEVASCNSLQEAISFAKKKNLSILILGEGSNSVFANNYHGLVILNRIMGLEVISEDHAQVEIKVGAGENWHALVEQCINRGWFGLENLALIPGCVGAAPMQNIGAYGVELSDSLTRVQYIDLKNMEMLELENAECQFAYRESCFKRELAGKVAITSISLRLSKRASVNVSYPALGKSFDHTPSPREVFLKVCEIRRAKLPMPEDIPNSGSFFKNPMVDLQTHQRLKSEYPNLVSFKVGDEFKLAAAWLIDQAGWKNKQIDGVGVHQEQALVITNPLHRPGRCVVNFALAIQQDIRQKFAVKLEIEPRIHGQ